MIIVKMELSLLAPSKVLSQTRPNFQELPFSHLKAAKLDVLESQYRRLNMVQWAKESVFPDEKIPADPQQFWAGVGKYKLSDDSHPFLELATYALECLILPVSNASVERVFSNVTAIKTKARNKMKLPMLDALTRIRCYLHFRGICCACDV